MTPTPAQYDALVEIANIGAGKAAKHLSLLLNDEVRMDVPAIAFGQHPDLPALLGISATDTLIGVQQKASGLIDAHIALLFHSEESQLLARKLVSSELPMVGVDMRALEHDAMTEIGNIVVSAFVSAIAALLGGNIKLSLPLYTEGNLGDVLRALPEHKDGAGGQNYVLLMKTYMRAKQRESEGMLIIAFSQADTQMLMQRLDEWLLSLGCGEI